MRRSLFSVNTNPQLADYPEVLPYAEAIRESYWVHNEYPWQQDVQDFRVGLTEDERGVVTRALLAISQVEVQVKTFWRDLGTHFPKAEFDAVGVTFAENEVRHLLGYSHLLSLLGLNREFDRINEFPALRDRLNYHEGLTITSPVRDDPLAYLRKLLAFSMFVEYVSLFSQFYLMKSFHRHRNQFKGVSNLVDATTKEEELHGKFGFLLVDLFREEMPYLFDEGLKEQLATQTFKAFRAEEKVVRWIFSGVELDFITEQEVLDFVKHRMTLALEGVGYEGLMGEDLLVPHNPKAYEWFNVELLSTKHYDFFNQRPTNYSRMSKNFDDLF